MFHFYSSATLKKAETGRAFKVPLNSEEDSGKLHKKAATNPKSVKNNAEISEAVRESKSANERKNEAESTIVGKKGGKNLILEPTAHNDNFQSI